MFWLALLVVAGLALAVGSGAIGAGGAKRPTLYQRSMELAGQYRCPVCQGESLAAAGAPEAVEIRLLIREWLREGWSPLRIRSYLVEHYGVSILEKPPASGVTSLVWILPALAAGFGAVGLGFGFRRWRRADVAAEAGAGPPASTVTAAAAALRTATPQRAILAAAVGPAVAPDPETEAGQAPSSEPVALDGAPPAPRRWPYRYQRATLLAGVALMVAAAGLLVIDRSWSPRSAGGTVTGSLTGIPAELQQASALAATDPAAALALYGTVLTGDPDQPVALTAEGWIYAQAGFAAQASSFLAKAERADPSYGPAHFYRALVMLDYDKRPAVAVAELKWYLAHRPDPALRPVARAALAKAQSALR